MRKKFPFCCIFMVLFMTACASQNSMESFLRADVDLTYVTKVAVVPFENNSKEQFAAERIRGMAITQILSQGLFDVVDKGLVDSALREEAVDLSKAPMDAPTMKRLGSRLAAQAVLLGSIDQAGVVQRGNNSYPELSITLRLVDSNTGMIFWQASGNRSGESMGKRLFGFSSDDDFKIALKLLRQIFATISAEQKVKLPMPAAAPDATTTPESVQKIEPQGDGATQGVDNEDGQIVPAGEGEDKQFDEEIPMGLDESLTQERPQVHEAQPAGPVVEGQKGESNEAQAQEAPVEQPLTPTELSTPSGQDKPAEPSPPPAQDEISEPSPPSAPLVAPPSQAGEQAWPE